MPPDGLSRAEWEARRRERLERPRAIRVTVALVEAEELAPGRRRVRFVQAYESDLFQDRVCKTLDLVWDATAWRIAAERAEG